ncbi:MAG: phage terminase large subunit family protein [Beijerinckiaceae bacterium]|nr:phage terminase large subunit family protein [Beijerinckiaceae bacterium]
MTRPAPELLDAFAVEIEQRPRRSAAAWADACRILPPDGPEPGPWRTERVPYTRAICEAFADPAVDTVIVAMGSQMAKTETILNLLGAWFDDGPLLPCLFVAPTQRLVQSMSGDRFRKMIESTPRLRDRMARGHADKVAEKWIAGVRLGFAWAGSATELASHPNARVLADEIDRMTDLSEGDPIEIVNARRDAYQDSKLGLFSTPTIEGASRIWLRFEEGTMHKWAWHCDHCRAPFVPSLALLHYPRDASLTQVRELARVHCPHCGGDHHDARRFALNAAGRYLPHRLTDTGDHEPIEVAPPNRVASFWVSGLASPFKGFGDRAEEHARAERSKDPKRLQACVNTRFGEPFKVKGEAPEWQALRALVRDVVPGVVPHWARILTMGTDVQRDGLWYVIRAWGYDPVLQSDRSHLVEYGHLHGDPDFDDVWLAWRARTFAEFQGARLAARDVVPDYLITAGLCDSGFNPARDRFKRPEHRVYQWCQRTQWRQQPSKGHDTQAEPVKLSKLDRMPSGRIVPGGLRLWHVDTDHFKSRLHADMRTAVEQDDPTFTLHADTGDDYLRQVTAEALIVKPNGARVWTVAKSRDNHLFDCEVLAMAAAYIHRGKWAGDFTAQGARQASAARPAPADQAPAAPPAPGGYFRRPEGPYIRPRR